MSRFPDQMQRRVPGVAAVVLLGLVALSPANRLPQATANEAYRHMFSGEFSSAVLLFEEALASDPAFPYRWSDVGVALAANGTPQEAEIAFRRSLELAPGDPRIALRAMNFRFGNGEVPLALRSGSQVLRLVSEYDALVFRTYLRMRVTPEEIRTDGIGGNRRAALSFFEFRLAEAPKSALDADWRWLEQSRFVDAATARDWSVWLLRNGSPREAASVWQDHVDTDPPSRRNVIHNSGFERTPFMGGFDWNWSNVPAVAISRVNNAHHQGDWCLRIDFSGTENIDFSGVRQPIWLPPGRYRLSGWVKAAGISTDQGVGLSIRFADASIPAVSTVALSGTRDWQQVSVEFAIPGPEQRADVTVFRRRSLDFDNRIKGTAWIDDVALERLSDVQQP